MKIFRVYRGDADHSRLARLDNVDEVFDQLHQYLRMSTDAAAATCGNSSRSYCSLAGNDNDNGNNYHPFYFHRVAGLLPADYFPREQFSDWFLKKTMQFIKTSLHYR